MMKSPFSFSKCFISLIFVLVLIASSIHSSSLEEKVRKLNFDSKDSSKIIILDHSKYSLYFEAPRNYSIILLLTALSPDHNCQVCQ